MGELRHGGGPLPVADLGQVLAATAALAAASVLFADRQVVVNTSPSVPPGLYVRSSDPPTVGRLVDFRVPASGRPYVFARTGRDGYDWYILKPVVAGPGDRVDSTGAWLRVNGRAVAPMPPAADAAGRPLPAWRAARVLGHGEFLVVSTRVPNSFDSRCYGPVRDVAAVRVPLVTW
jgi:conjugative transfer signal peptidase TraF